MPGAQSRRGFESRVASSARRGANVPAGAPGVYRVLRRPVSALTSDPGLAAVAPSEWIQPDDVTGATAAFGSVFETHMDSGGLSSYTVRGVTLANEVESITGVGGSSSWACMVVRADSSNLDAWPASPTLPPGAIGVEHESPQGTLLTASLSGALTLQRSGSDGQTIVGEVWTAPLDSLTPGVPRSDIPTSYGPSHTTAGVQVFSRTGLAVNAMFTTPEQTFPAVEQVVGWRIGEAKALAEQDYLPTGVFFFVTLSGQTSAPVVVTYSYRPPRYRFIY